MTEHKTRQRFSNLICKASIAFAVLCLLMPHTTFADDKAKNEQERVKNSGEALDALVNSESGIPTDLLNKSECVIILPSVKKGGFIIAGQYGKGLMTCRTGAKFDGPWSAPIMMQSSGGGVGFRRAAKPSICHPGTQRQGGTQDNERKSQAGADASIAAGPVGRNAEAATNAALNAEMLSYSRTAGVFAGVSLSGTSLGPDSGANEDLYGKKVSGEEIWTGNVQTPDSAKEMLATLEAKSPKNLSAGKP